MTTEAVQARVKKDVYGGCGHGKPNPDMEGERILEYAWAYDLLLCNMCLKERNSHLITYRSGYSANQIEALCYVKRACASLLQM